MKITCCIDCNKRHSGCHSVCPEYKEQRQQLDEHNAIVRAARLKEIDITRPRKVNVHHKNH